MSAQEGVSPVLSSSAASPAPFDWAPWMVFIATLTLSFKGIAVKAAYGTGMGIAMVVAMRFVFSVPLFWAGERLINRGKVLAPLGWREIRATAGVASLFAIATISDLSALSFIDAGVSRVILFTFPAVILIVKAIERRSLPETRHLIAFAVTYGGLVLVILPGRLEMAAGLSWEGIALALVSAVTYGLFLTRTQSLTKRMGSARFTVWSNTFVVLYVLLATPFLGGGWGLPLEGLGWSLVNAIFCTVVPFFLLFEGINRWGAEKAGLLALLGPVITIVFACWLLGETIELAQLAGFGIVLLGVATLQGTDRVILRALRGSRT
ncbi:MAG: DMT family transporter [Rhodospirillum sp.]|nr:DMT family transporter [Rhodospirillum sp.]